MERTAARSWEMGADWEGSGWPTEGEGAGRPTEGEDPSKWSLVRPVDQVEPHSSPPPPLPPPGKEEAPHSSPPPLPPEKEAEGRRRRREEIREGAAAAAAGGAGRPWRRVLRRTNILGFRWLEWAVALPRFQW